MLWFDSDFWLFLLEGGLGSQPRARWVFRWKFESAGLSCAELNWFGWINSFPLLTPGLLPIIFSSSDPFKKKPPQPRL
jgi:hypothetical protein